MNIAQQIVGVNERLGNYAVPEMQGTTRVIFDTTTLSTATDATFTYFTGVSGRTYPLTNLNSNRFEVGESLAIQGFSFHTYTATDPLTLGIAMDPAANNAAFRGGILNFYIGNQRVIKDLEILSYARFGLGESVSEAIESNVFRLETPIVIPPQIEFYATLRFSNNSNFNNVRGVLVAFGTGTLLNTKSTF